jgi:hypothetical protein
MSNYIQHTRCLYAGLPNHLVMRWNPLIQTYLYIKKAITLSLTCEVTHYNMLLLDDLIIINV